jgi:PleD family two-component response regulator
MPTVLLLEDQDSDAREIESVLSQIGDFEVKRLQAASRAIEYLSDMLDTDSELPALMVVALNLPNCSGYRITTRRQKETWIAVKGVQLPSGATRT